MYTATFQPDEAGEWSIAVTHDGEHIQGGPFTCFVFDPNAIKVGTQPVTYTLLDTYPTFFLCENLMDINEACLHEATFNRHMHA